MSAAGEFRCAFFARSYAASLAFYRDGLGLDVIESWDRGRDDRGTLLRAGRGVIEVLARPASPPPDTAWDYRPPAGVTLVLEVADVDARHERLVAAGVAVAEGPTDQPWGHRSVVVEDPDGLRLYLFSATAGTTTR